MNSPTADAAAARTYCAQLVKREARNFYFGFLLLPPVKRQAVYALYAFCRILDDAVDESDGETENSETLKQRFLRIVDGQGPFSHHDGCISTALSHTVSLFRIPRRYFEWIINGVLMDLDRSRYETFSELRRYLFGVASAVGLACMEIFGYRDVQAKRFAVALGYAMQMTNIIRDVKEDYLRGRIYLPGEDLRRFHVDEQQLGSSRTSEDVQRLLAFETGRARTFYDEALRLWPRIARDAAPCPMALCLIYHALLEHISKNRYAVLEQRFSLPAWKKLCLMIRAKSRFLL